MPIYLKTFDNHSSYESASPSLILPNCSVCVSEKDVHYNKRAKNENTIIFIHDYQFDIVENSCLRYNNFQGATYFTPYLDHIEIFGPNGYYKYSSTASLNDTIVPCKGIYTTYFKLKNNNNTVPAHMFRMGTFNSYVDKFCPYKEVIIPSNITSIGTYAFNQNSTDEAKLDKITNYSHSISLGTEITNTSTTITVYTVSDSYSVWEDRYGSSSVHII